ncbi:hypothetical protein BGX33_004834 [Mortierella sp. NVP41]|nr:hypothetical protein BGX33_004834 [Mortierella sp. NVP41]
MEDGWRVEDDDLLLEFLTDMFPNPQYLTALRWEDVNIMGFVSVLRKVPKDSKIKSFDLDEDYIGGMSQENLRLISDFKDPEDPDVLTATVEIGSGKYISILVLGNPFEKK